MGLGSASGERGHTPGGKPRGARDRRGRHRRAGGAGRNRDRRRRHPDRRGVRARVRGTALRVQGRHRRLPGDVHRAFVPEDAPGPDRLQQRQSGPRRTLELGRLRVGAGDRRSRRSRVHGGPRAGERDRPIGHHATRWKRTTSMRSSRRPTDQRG